MLKTISFLRRKRLQRDPVHSGVGAVQVLFSLTLSVSYAEHRFLLIKDQRYRQTETVNYRVVCYYLETPRGAESYCIG